MSFNGLYAVADLWPNLQSLLGLFALLALAWLWGERRGPVPWRLIIASVSLQFLLALVLLRLPVVSDLLLSLSQVVLVLQQATQVGTAFVFGYLGGGPTPYTVHQPQHGLVLAFQVLPLVLVMSALSALLFYWRILPLIVTGFSWMLQRSLGIGGVVGMAAAANVFVGMVEAPLLVRFYLKQLSRTELLAIMIVGLSTIAGTMLVVYASFLDGVIATPIVHILTASVISAPAGLVVAALMIPADQRESVRLDDSQSSAPSASTMSLPYQSAMDALVQGISQGAQLLIQIVSALLVVVALVELINLCLGVLPQIGEAPLTLQRLLGWVMAPFTWLLGLSVSELQTAGSLLGIKTAVNEFLAFQELKALSSEALSERSRLILAYALCGFTNPVSLGILISGLTAMVPERHSEIVALGWRALLGGVLATSMTGAVIGVMTIAA